MKIFVSFGYSDLKEIEAMVRSIPSAHEVYYLREENDIGLSSWETLRKRIDWADIFIVYLSTSTIERAMAVGNEVGYAIKAGKFVIPLKERGVSTSDIGMVADLKWIPVDIEHQEDAYTILADTIWDYAGKKQKQKQKEWNALLWVIGGLILASLFGNDEEY